MSGAQSTYGLVSPILAQFFQLVLTVLDHGPEEHRCLPRRPPRPREERTHKPLHRLREPAHEVTGPRHVESELTNNSQVLLIAAWEPGEHNRRGVPGVVLTQRKADKDAVAGTRYNDSHGHQYVHAHPLCPQRKLTLVSISHSGTIQAKEELTVAL